MKLILSLIFFLSSATQASAAVCSPCTKVVGSVIDLGRGIGVRDDVVGLFFGALLALIFIWLVKVFDKNNWNFAFRNIVLLLIPIAMVYFLFDGKMMYISTKILFFKMDTFLFSTIVGAFLFYYSPLAKAGISVRAAISTAIIFILVSVFFSFFPPSGWPVLI